MLLTIDPLFRFLTLGSIASLRCCDRSCKEAFDDKITSGAREWERQLNLPRARRSILTMLIPSNYHPDKQSGYDTFAQGTAYASRYNPSIGFHIKLCALLPSPPTSYVDSIVTQIVSVHDVMLVVNHAPLLLKHPTIIKTITDNIITYLPILPTSFLDEHLPITYDNITAITLAPEAFGTRLRNVVAALDNRVDLLQYYKYTPDESEGVASLFSATTHYSILEFFAKCTHLSESWLSWIDKPLLSQEENACHLRSYCVS